MLYRYVHGTSFSYHIIHLSSGLVSVISFRVYCLLVFLVCHLSFRSLRRGATVSCFRDFIASSFRAFAVSCSQCQICGTGKSLKSIPYRWAIYSASRSSVILSANTSHQPEPPHPHRPVTFKFGLHHVLARRVSCKFRPFLDVS